MNNTNITFTFSEKIEKANKDFHLFENASKILVALSGGADSTSLLVSLCGMREKYGFELFALHVNHMIRGAEAERDELFAHELCKGLGVRFFCERVDVPSLCKEMGQSPELCARNVRYEAFERVCRENGITHLATAHNACDNAETVLFNLVRGSGARGLCGIPPKRSLGDSVTVIRPLIYVERREIEEYLSHLGQSFVTDSTNNENDYTRNFIRNELMPLVRQINPDATEAISRAAFLLRGDDNYLSNLAEENLTDSIDVLSRLDKAVLSRVIIRLFAEKTRAVPDEKHINELCEKIYSFKGGTMKMSFNEGMTALLSDSRLCFVKDERKKKNEPVPAFEKMCGEGEVFFEENPYCLYISFDQNKDIPQTLADGKIVYKKYTTDYLYFDTIPRVLCVRNRRDGDKIKSGHITKSVKRLLNGSHVSERERYLVPFVCKDEEILLVPGVCVGDAVRQSEANKKKISITLYKST